jgi:hypothetical protein
MANNMKTFKITTVSGEKCISSSVRSSAADLLSDLAQKNGFDPEESACNFKGSNDNQEMVRLAIFERWGNEVCENYKPAVNVKPKTAWLQEGCTIKDGENALCFIHTYRKGQPRAVALYHELQVEKPTLPH